MANEPSIATTGPTTTDSIVRTGSTTTKRRRSAIRAVPDGDGSSASGGRVRRARSPGVLSRGLEILRTDPWLVVPFLVAGVVLSLVDALRLQDPIPAIVREPLVADGIDVQIEFVGYPAGRHRRGSTRVARRTRDPVSRLGRRAVRRRRARRRRRGRSHDHSFDGRPGSIAGIRLASRVRVGCRPGQPSARLDRPAPGNGAVRSRLARDLPLPVRAAVRRAGTRRRRPFAPRGPRGELRTNGGTRLVYLRPDPPVRTGRVAARRCPSRWGGGEQRHRRPVHAAVIVAFLEQAREDG